MLRLQILYRLIFIALTSLMVFCANTSAEEAKAAAAKIADVRLVIDVSGSMKRNDPNNLRQPAVELLVQLLPEGSKAGVWAFGKWVNMLVPHKVVDDAWRKDAEKFAKEINSAGLFTNIGEALEKAAYDLPAATEDFRSSIILLTDGMVDINKNPEINKKEWRRIVDEVLPKLKAAGVTIHTIALSDNADKNLMTKLSLATDGLAEVAYSADDLMRIFLKAFDVAVPAEQVPLADNQFVIDSSVEEFTALIFRENPAEKTSLVGPDGKLFSADKTGADAKWHRASNYDLITVKYPLEGSWSVNAKMAPDSRITVVSNLNLRVVPMSNNIFNGFKGKLTFSLQEDGKTITREEFLTLMDITVQMEAGNDEFSLKQFWQSKIDQGEKGIFTQALPVFDKDGIYQLNLLVDGKTFIRQFNHQFTVREPFGAEVKQVFQDGKLEYRIVANAYGPKINVRNTQIVATVEAPGGRKKIRPLQATDEDTWEASLLPDTNGEYKVVIKAKGAQNDGSPFDLELDPISFNYSSEGGFVEAKEPFFEPSPEPTAEPTAQPQEPKTETEEDKNSAKANNTPMPSWMLYTILGVGNLIVFAGGYLIFRKLMGGKSDEEVLEQFSEEKIAAVPVPDPEPQPAAPEEIDDEEEPPMEDLDTASEEVAQVAAAPDFSDEDDLDPLPEASSTNDDFDDLDAMAMAMEQESASETDGDEPLPAEAEDDDMVTAMLKAQGLDLAEDELDDAISSLIDDLDHEPFGEDEDKDNNKP